MLLLNKDFVRSLHATHVGEHFKLSTHLLSSYGYLVNLSISVISIYTLSDLGDLSNLIGSLSRTIQQYSPPSEWIMCELSFFPIFLEKDLLKVDKILGLTFFQARKDFEGFKTAFFHLLLLSFVVDGLFTKSPIYSPRRGRFVNSAFPNEKNLNRSLFMTNKFESKCLQKF